MSAQTTPLGIQCASAFEAAAMDTIKAWTSTSLLSMTKGLTVERCKQVLSEKSSTAISDMLVDMTGTAYAAYAVKSGMDAGRAAKLGRIVIRLICIDLPPEVKPVVCISTLHHRCMTWIERGHVADSMPDLKQISTLTGDSPEIRLALLAPFAPALAACAVVLRADERRYPFASENLNGQASK